MHSHGHTNSLNSTKNLRADFMGEYKCSRRTHLAPRLSAIGEPHTRVACTSAGISPGDLHPAINTVVAVQKRLQNDEGLHSIACCDAQERHHVRDSAGYVALELLQCLARGGSCGERSY